MKSTAIDNPSTRIGIQYFQDSNHYREKDAGLWIPKLQELGISWLILPATSRQAIPEYFINALVEAGIEPVLQFNGLSQSPTLVKDVNTLVNAYAKWGVKYAILFDRPNCTGFWQTQTWMQTDLVERFLDLFIPVAEVIQKSGITPIFPPLEPGGDYWDTAFLREALQGILRRDVHQLSDHLALSAYVYPGANPLTWGAGGPERWPGAKPYSTPKNQEDQRGFYIFSWYQSIAQAVFDKTLPILLLEASSSDDNQPFENEFSNAEKEHDNQCLAIARLLTENYGSETTAAAESLSISDPVPDSVLCFNYASIASSSENDQAVKTWFQSDGSAQPIVDLFQQWKIKSKSQSVKKSILANSAPVLSLSHYVLIPECHENLLAYYFDVMRPFLIKNKPAIGFSVEEALLAKKITVVGDIQQYPDGTLEKILGSGCEVEQIFRDGTIVASSKSN